MAWFDQMFSPQMQYGPYAQNVQEANDGMGGFLYGPFRQLWEQRQLQAQQPHPWQGKNPGHIGTPWTGGPGGPDVGTPWHGQPQGPDVPTPWTGQQPYAPPEGKPPSMHMQPMSQRRPPVRGVIRK